MHGEIAVNRSGLVLNQTSAPVMQISSAAVHTETGFVRAEMAALQTGMAVHPQRLWKAPPGIVVMYGGLGTTSDGIAVVYYQPAEMPAEIVVMQAGG